MFPSPGMARRLDDSPRRHLQGSSTITQQYIKVLYLNSEQTLARKFKELFLAYKINNQLSKDQILEGYLNTIYFGTVPTVSKPPAMPISTVTRRTSACRRPFLAAVINNPAASIQPTRTICRGFRERYTYVIMSMAETGAITQEEAAKYASKLPKFPDVAANQRYGGPKGFLLKMVERELATADIDASRVHGGGLKIVTTFDKDAQDAAVKAAQKNTKEAADASGEEGLNCMRPSRRSMLAAGASRCTAARFRQELPQLGDNRAAYGVDLQDLRPAAASRTASACRGSTATPSPRLVSQRPVRNEYSYQYGPAVSLTKATTDSINTAFVDLTTKMENGPEKIIKMAQAAGAPKGAGWDKHPGSRSAPPRSARWPRRVRMPPSRTTARTWPITW